MIYRDLNPKCDYVSESLEFFYLFVLILSFHFLPVGLGCGLWIIILISLSMILNPFSITWDLGTTGLKQFPKINSTKLVPCEEGQTLCTFHHHTWKVMMHIILLKVLRNLTGNKTGVFQTYLIPEPLSSVISYRSSVFWNILWELLLQTQDLTIFDYCARI